MTITDKDLLRLVESLKKQTSFNKVLRGYKESKYSILEEEELIFFAKETCRGNVRYNQALEDVRSKIVQFLSEHLNK